ncbi:MAG: hypothetical protein ACKO8U_21280 [Pirellula sp.]
MVFWDERFEEIADDIPKEQPSVVYATKPTKQGSTFELILPMDPFTGRILYSVVSSVIGLVLIALMYPFRSALTPMLELGLLGVLSIFGLVAVIYRYRAHYVNLSSQKPVGGATCDGSIVSPLEGDWT